MSAVEKNQSNVVSLIKSDAEYIKREIDEANQAFGKSLEHYRNAGERLASVRDDLKAKGQREKGVGFQAWVEANCEISKRRAYEYISIFDNWNELVSAMDRTNEIFGLVDALKAIKDIKATALQARDDTYDTTGTEIVNEIESTANKKVLEAHKQTETERKAREKAEKELDKLVKQELAIKAGEIERQQQASIISELQRQIATIQKPEVLTVTVIDDSATKELEKVKLENQQLKQDRNSLKTELDEFINQHTLQKPEEYSDLVKAAFEVKEREDKKENSIGSSSYLILECFGKHEYVFSNLLNNPKLTGDLRNAIKTIHECIIRYSN